MPEPASCQLAVDGCSDEGEVSRSKARLEITYEVYPQTVDIL